MAAIINKIIPGSLKEYVRRKSGVPDIFFSIERLKKNGFNPKQVVDVGAYEGIWTKKCSTIFPNAHFLMVEAMQKKKEELEKIAALNKNVSVEIEVLGATSGKEVFFAEIETASSVLEETGMEHVRTKKLTTTLNDVAKRNGIDKVDFLKLDVQGYELEILKGFDHYLHNTDVILSEVSLLDIHKEVPLMRDVLNFMYNYGFVAYDICSVNTRRPLDNALWQTDLLFVKENSVFRSNKKYQ